MEGGESPWEFPFQDRFNGAAPILKEVKVNQQEAHAAGFDS